MNEQIMENEEIVVATEEIAESNSGTALKVVFGVVVGALVGSVIYKKLIKPLVQKIKSKKSAVDSDDEDDVKMIFDDYGNPIE